MNPFHDCVAKRLGALATLTELNPEKESELRINSCILILLEALSSKRSEEILKSND